MRYRCHPPQLPDAPAGPKLPAWLRRLVAVWVACWLVLPAQAEVAVIVHPDNPVAMDRDMVVDLYLGRSEHYPDGRYALPFDLAGDHPLRERFFRALNGMSIRNLNSYWSRLMFGGNRLPPQRLPDPAAVHDIVATNRSAIGFIDARDVRSDVRVVLMLAEPSIDQP